MEHVASRPRFGSINGVRYPIYGTPARFGDTRNINLNGRELCLMIFDTPEERAAFEIRLHQLPTANGEDFDDWRDSCIYHRIAGEWYKRFIQP